MQRHSDVARCLCDRQFQASASETIRLRTEVGFALMPDSFPGVCSWATRSFTAEWFNGRSQPEADQLQASSAPQRLLPVMSAREFTVLATQRLCMRLWHLGPSGWFQSDAETGASTTT